ECVWSSDVCSSDLFPFFFILLDVYIGVSYSGVIFLCLTPLCVCVRVCVCVCVCDNFRHRQCSYLKSVCVCVCVCDNFRHRQCSYLNQHRCVSCSVCVCLGVCETGAQGRRSMQWASGETGSIISDLSFFTSRQMPPD